jgi:hypothetical protein
MKRKNLAVFQSRISAVLAGVVLAIFILLTVSLLHESVYAACIIIIGLWLLWILNMLTGFRYVIDDDTLYLKLWAMTFFSVKIMDIVSVRRAYSPLSLSAISRKRLCLYVKNNPKYTHYYVSPVREQEFLDVLKSVNTEIDIQIEK